MERKRQTEETGTSGGGGGSGPADAAIAGGIPVAGATGATAASSKADQAVPVRKRHPRALLRRQSSGAGGGAVRRKLQGHTRKGTPKGKGNKITFNVAPAEPPAEPQRSQSH